MRELKRCRQYLLTTTLMITRSYTVLNADERHQPMLIALHGLGCCRLGPQYLCVTPARRDIGRPSIGSVHPMSCMYVWIFTMK